MTDGVNASANLPMVMATGEQETYNLFADLISQKLDVKDSPKDIGFRRKNIFVELTSMTLLQQRLLDAAYFIVAQGAGDSTTFNVDLRFFRWLMRFDSRNFKHLRSLIEACQTKLISVSDTHPDERTIESTNWISVQLLGPAAINNGRFYFELPKALIKQIREPGPSHWFSLRIATAFDLAYARAIYIQVITQVDEGSTDWISVDEVRGWTGDSLKSASEFKYFKRDYLEPAKNQINEVSDIELSYETRGTIPGSRKITEIKFRMKRKEGKVKALETLRQREEIYRVLTEEFRLSEAALTEIAQNSERWSDDWIANAIEFTRHRLQSGVIKKNPSGYLMKALRENLSLTPAEKKMIVVNGNGDDLFQTEEPAPSKKKTRKSAAPVVHDHEVKSAKTFIPPETEKPKEIDKTQVAMEEEIAMGYQMFNEIDDNIKETILPQFLKSAECFLIIRRQKIDTTSITIRVVLDNEKLSDAFYLFVYRKLRSE